MLKTDFTIRHKDSTDFHVLREVMNPRITSI